MKNVVKVLIVDDDKSSSQVFGEVVKRLGFKPIIANKPADALNIARLQTVHAALVDVLLPKMSGVDLVTEFRKTNFGDNPVIFVSGIFKDKVFANDAMKKTGAVDFLFKPFGPDELSNSLRKALASLMTAERWSVQSLLLKKFKNVRERARAIENLEQINGLDFPYLLSFLLDGEVSGNLNIVNDGGEIFGVTLMNGAITGVDSGESQSAQILALIANGFLAQEDWDAYLAKGAKKITMQTLIKEGLVSPHAVSVAEREQILADLKSICSAGSLQINLSPTDATDDVSNTVIRMGDLMAMFLFSMQELFTRKYLEDFYLPVLNNKLYAQQSNEELEAVWKAALFRPIENAKSILVAHGSIADMLEKFPEETDRVYHCIHILVLNGWIIFDDADGGKGLAAQFERYKTLYADLSSRPADKVFEYFGASARSQKSVYDNILEEYMKSNDPSHIPKEAQPEAYELCVKCMAIVKNAYGIMTDEALREKYLAEQKVQTTAKIKESNRLLSEGLEQLRKGQFQPALKILKDAEALYPSTMQFLITVWAEIKCGAGNNRQQMQAFLKRLESLPLDDRKSAYYFMALGLVKKALGEPNAVNYFEKALQLDSMFVEARREMNSNPNAGAKKEKLDIFTGDITQVVSQLFRRKAD